MASRQSLSSERLCLESELVRYLATAKKMGVPMERRTDELGVKRIRTKAAPSSPALLPTSAASRPSGRVGRGVAAQG